MFNGNNDQTMEILKYRLKAQKNNTMHAININHFGYLFLNCFIFLASI